MGKILKEATIRNGWFWIFATISIAMIIISFIIPPTGVVDSSVLAATGELFAFASLATVIHAIDKGMNAKVRKGETEIEVNNEQE